MPSETPKQARTMAACAHGADLEVCKHIPHKVAVDYNRADKGGRMLSQAMKKSTKGSPPMRAHELKQGHRKMGTVSIGQLNRVGRR